MIGRKLAKGASALDRNLAAATQDRRALATAGEYIRAAVLEPVCDLESWTDPSHFAQDSA